MGLKMPSGAREFCRGMGLEMPSENGLTDAIRRLLVGGWAYRCHMVMLNCTSMVSGRVSEGHPCFGISLNWGLNKQQIDVHVWRICKLFSGVGTEQAMEQHPLLGSVRKLFSKIEKSLNQLVD